jgi:tetratricopeptide (TPR) repeat protein
MDTYRLPSRLPVLLTLLCTALAITAQANGQTSTTPRAWAVVIGISKYAKLPAGWQLQFAERDAALMASALQAAGMGSSNIRLLIGAEATTAAIKTAIGVWLARSASEQDTAYIFFSGHALVEREFGESYLLAYDSDPQNAYATAISISELKQALSRRVRVRHVVLIADAVRRDLLNPQADGAAASSAFVKALEELATSRAGLLAILANGPGEFSREGQRWGGYGVFTKFLTEAISGSGDLDGNGLVTAREAFNYLSEKVSQETSNQQHPWRSAGPAEQITLARVAPLTQPAIEAKSMSRPAHGQPPSNPAQAKAASNETPARSAAGGGALERASKPQLTPPETQAVIPIVPNAGAIPSDIKLSQPAITPPPKPAQVPPSISLVLAVPALIQPLAIAQPLPVPILRTPPSPLVIQIEAAIASNTLIEPKGASAWELYQRLVAEAGSMADAEAAARMLSEALKKASHKRVAGDLRVDNISSKLDEFKLAGQMLARARSLQPNDAEIAILEKLSSAEALIALQFYDEAERSLRQLQPAQNAAIENALGLAYQGMLSDWQAERAFKRAIELDPNWAAPHYNLAMLYRNQRKDAALLEFERAAALSPDNVALITALGDEYFARQQWMQAASAYRKGLAISPDDVNLHMKLGHALYSQGLRQEANREYQKARELRQRQ